MLYVVDQGRVHVTALAMPGDRERSRAAVADAYLK
jgi:hypothetical protein